MLTIVILVGSVAILVVLLLVIVVIGIRQEPPTEELSEQAPSLTTGFVRRLLGVHVRKPDSRTTSLVGRNGQAESQMRTGQTLFDARARHAIRVETPSRSELLEPNAPQPSPRGR